MSNKKLGLFFGIPFAFTATAHSFGHRGLEDPGRKSPFKAIVELLAESQEVIGAKELEQPLEGDSDSLFTQSGGSSTWMPGGESSAAEFSFSLNQYSFHLSLHSGLSPPVQA